MTPRCQTADTIASTSSQSSSRRSRATDHGLTVRTAGHLRDGMTPVCTTDSLTKWTRDPKLPVEVG